MTLNASLGSQGTDSETLSRLALTEFGQGAKNLSIEAAVQWRLAQRALLRLVSVAVVQSILAVVVCCGASLAPSTTAPEMKIVAGSTVFSAVLFWLLAAWSYRAPLPAAIGGLCFYLTSWWATATYAYASIERRLGEKAATWASIPNSGTLIRLAIVFGLGNAVLAAAKHQRLMRQLSAENGLPATLQPPRLAGVWTSLGLYVLLLYLSINMIALWGSSELTPLLFKKLVGVSSIVVMTWSIASWRDVYRPLVRPINPGWYLGAIGMGCFTFATARSWVIIVQHWAKLPPVDLTNASGVQDAWWMQMLLTAVQPALIEEIAFRGIIFAGLARVMRGHEAIIVTALMFMVLHINPPAFPHLLLGGLLFGWMRWRTGSWLPGVFMHFTHNFLTLIVK